MTSVQEHADDARALLETLDGAPAIVIGRSYGGTVGLDLALRHPGAVRGLVLLEAAVLGLSPEYDAWFESLRATLEDAVRERGTGVVGEIVLREALGAWEELPAAMRHVFEENGPALLAEIRGGETTDNSKLGELDIPTLIVSAEGSPEPLQRGTEGLERALPRARRARVAGGHAIDPAGPEVLAFVAEALAA